MIKFFLFLAAATVVSCTQHPEVEVKEVESISVDELPEDFIVPQVVWDSMKAKPTDEKKAESEHGGSGGAPAEKEKPIIYTSVKVILKEKNKGVLSKPLMTYEFSRGGGELDLSKVVGPMAGTFFISFELPEYENALQKKAFFVSKNRQRKVDGEILGSGCNKVLDVSSQLYKLSHENGIKINTTRNRHDSILGGHMIFLGETEKNWLLTQVTFFDSARTDLFCKGFRTVATEVH